MLAIRLNTCPAGSGTCREYCKAQAFKGPCVTREQNSLVKIDFAEFVQVRSNSVLLQDGLRQKKDAHAKSAAFVHAKILSEYQAMEPKSQLMANSSPEIWGACMGELPGILKRSLSLLKNSARASSVEAILTWNLRAAAAFLKCSKNGSVCHPCLFLN